MKTFTIAGFIFKPVVNLIATARDGRVPISRIVILLAFHLGGTIVEILALFSLLPILQFLQNNGDIAKLVHDTKHWRILQDISSFTGIPLKLGTLLVLSFVLLLVRQAFVYVRMRFAAVVMQEGIAELRLRLFRSFLAAKIDAQEEDKGGVVVNDMITETKRANQYILTLVSIVGFIILFMVYVIGLLFLSTSMTAVALVVFGATFVLLQLQVKKSTELGKQVTVTDQDMAGFVVERLRQARLIRLAGMESVEATAISRLLHAQCDAVVRVSNLLASIEIVVEPVVVGAGFVFLLVAVSLLNMPLAQVAVFLLILMRLLPLVKEGGRLRQSAASLAFAYASVVARIARLDRRAEDLRPGGIPFSGLANKIQFQKVTYQYPSTSQPALRKIDLLIPANKMTAIVGPSGAGKSTLVDLLPRMREVTGGQILFDDVGQDGMKVVSLRTGIAFASQRSEFFNTTVAEHIRYGKVDASDDEVRASAQLAQAEEFILEMPSGYDTLLGDNASNLSQGQRQRLDLARALVRRAPVLILDEPTSNLDAESEAKFLNALQSIRSQTRTTIIVIAHRLSTIAAADQIVVIEAGQVRAVGTHAELLVSDRWYRGAYETQQLSDETSKAAQIA